MFLNFILSFLGGSVVKNLPAMHAEYIMRSAGLDEAQLESRLRGEISTSDMQITPPLRQKAKN